MLYDADRLARKLPSSTRGVLASFGMVELCLARVMLIFEPLTTGRCKSGGAWLRWAAVRKLANDQACRLSLRGSPGHRRRQYVATYWGRGGRCSMPRLRAA
jgi:hypothetical protein